MFLKILPSFMMMRMVSGLAGRGSARRATCQCPPPDSSDILQRITAQQSISRPIIFRAHLLSIIFAYGNRDYGVAGSKGYPISMDCRVIRLSLRSAFPDS